MAQETMSRAGSNVPAATDEGQERSFYTWSGWSGLVATAAFVVTIVAVQMNDVASPQASGETAGYLDAVSRASGPTYTYGIAGVVLAVLYIPMAAAIHRLLARSTAAWFGSAAVITGLAVLLPAYVINLLIPYGLVPAGAELGTAAEAPLYAILSYADAAAEVLFAIGSALSLGIGPLLWGYAWRRSFGSHHWLAWTALVTGASGMVWFVWLATDFAVALLLVNVVASLVLFTGMSVVLLARGRAGR